MTCSCQASTPYKSLCVACTAAFDESVKIAAYVESRKLPIGRYYRYEGPWIQRTDGTRYRDMEEI